MAASKDSAARLKVKIEEWRNGPEGFFQWVADIKPRILTASNKYEPIEFTDFQCEAIAPALERLPNGECKYQTCCWCWPRRHGKSHMPVLIALHRFTCWPAQNIKALANSVNQIQGTSFKLIRNIILNTPTMLSMVGRENVQGLVIRYPALQSEIEAVPCNPSVLYGQKINLVLTTELHAATDDSALGVLSSSVGDSVDGQVLIDSTTDGPNGPIARLEKLHDDGEGGVYTHRIEYADLNDAMTRAPAWIRRSWLENQHKTLLPAFFGTQILNKRADASNSLFLADDIAAAKSNYRNPLDPATLPSLIYGRKFIVGGGIDRAFGFSKHGDNTVWTCVAKVATGDEEPEYYVLNQQLIQFSSGFLLKRAIAKDNERYKMQNVVIERYNSQDIWSWCCDVKIPSEIVSASSTEQVSVFTELHRIVSERRLHFSRDLVELESELAHFIYDATGKHPSFEAARGFKDDRVFSLAWAIWALRQEELTAYTLNRIQCTSKSSYASYCYLRSGDLILPCAEQCEAHKKVEKMHIQYNSKLVGNELTLPEFYKSKVRLTGCKIYQGV